MMLVTYKLLLWKRFRWCFVIKVSVIGQSWYTVTIGSKAHEEQRTVVATR